MSAIYVPVSVLWGRITARAEYNEDGCLIWPGAVNSRGYGSICAGKRSVSVQTHHIAVLASGRAIPDGMTVDHMCHDSYLCLGGVKCQHRRCVDPNHLEVVTREANSARQWEREVCRKGHALSVRPNGKRRCKTCAADYAAIQRETRKAAS